MSQFQKLRIAAVAVILFGGLAALGIFWRLPIDIFVDVAFFPLDQAQSARSQSAALLAAIMAGLSTAFGVAIWRVAHDILPIAPDAAKRMVQHAAWSWFIVDGIGSLAVGAWFNVVMNTVFLLICLWPFMGSENAKGRQAPA